MIWFRIQHYSSHDSLPFGYLQSAARAWSTSSSINSIRPLPQFSSISCPSFPMSTAWFSLSEFFKCPMRWNLVEQITSHLTLNAPALSQLIARCQEGISTDPGRDSIRACDECKQVCGREGGHDDNNLRSLGRLCFCWSRKLEWRSCWSQKLL